MSEVHKIGDALKESRKRCWLFCKPIEELNETIGSEYFSPQAFEDPGHYVLLQRETSLMNKLLGAIDTEIRRPVGFRQVVLPKIVPLSTVEKAKLLGKWDDYLLVVKPLGETKGVKETYVLDPLQCLSFYQHFENKQVSVPIKWYDCSGPTYRNENLERLDPLIRQREFHRAEFIYLGTKEQVIEIREKCLERLERICFKLDLDYRIVVGEGCYEMPENNSVDCIPIKDVEVYIPQTDSWLEIAGCSVLGNTLTSRFNIKNIYGDELWSGCTGIGLERLIYAVEFVGNYQERLFR